MRNYYFTFGQAHFTVDGISMKDYYVSVTAPDFGSARELFCDHFAAPIMGSPTKWAFQYDQAAFDATSFPNGEFEHLTLSTPPAGDSSHKEM